MTLQLTDFEKLPATAVGYAGGDGLHLGNAKNTTSSFRALSESFKEPLVTRESFADYKAMGDAEQGRLKRMPGWVIRCPVEKGKRTRDSVQPGRLITIDIDEATPAFAERLLAGKVLPGTALFAHTTRGHTPEKPRFRLFILGDSEIDADHYQRVCRITAQEYDEDLSMTDKVSARVAQLMYRPGVSKNMRKHYIHYEQPGAEWDWQKAVHEWEKGTGHDSNNISSLPRFKGEKELREVAEQVERPQMKKGPVGAWCRAYNCIDMVLGKDGEDPILGHVYEVSQYGQNGQPERMSFIPGHSTDGVIIYDDGELIYSHHGSDPASDMTINAWDIVRYHRFDAAEDDETLPMGQRESWKKMVAFAKEHPAYVAQIAEERFSPEMMALDVDDEDYSWVEKDDDDEEDLIGDWDRIKSRSDQDELDELLGVPMASFGTTPLTPYQKLRAKRPPQGWIASQLELTQEGAIKNSLPNIASIITNDARLWRKIAFNAFSNQTVLLADIKTKNPRIPNLTCRDKRIGDDWVDINDIIVRSVLEMPTGAENMGYGMKVADRDLHGGIEMAGRNNTFHPVLDQMQEWREMGPPDVDPITDYLHRHLGAEKSFYTDQVMRMTMIASVARVTTPGCKFDYAPILQGATGIGKSTMIKIIYGEEFFGELDVDLADRQDVAEQTAGKHCLEMPELGSLNKADYNAAKAFMRRQHDDVRIAYGRRVAKLPRQFVTWGTTNESAYLKDPTGNRSYWVIKCETGAIDFAAILRERADLWRQAVYDHDQLRLKHPVGDMPLTLTGEALSRARELQEDVRQEELWETWKEEITTHMETPAYVGEVMREMDIEDWDEDLADRKVLRVAFTQTMASVILGMREGNLTNHTQNQTWVKMVASMKDEGWTKARIRVVGKQLNWHIIPDVTSEELRQGFRFTDDAEHTETGEPTDYDDLI